MQRRRVLVASRIADLPVLRALEGGAHPAGAWLAERNSESREGPFLSPSPVVGYRPVRRPREVRELEGRVLAALRERPGLTRMDVAARLGVEAPALALPIVHLLRAGILRREGHKAKTTYQPRLVEVVPAEGSGTR